MKNVIVIKEYDFDDMETNIIGVSDSVDNSKNLLEEYYGKNNYVQLEYNVADYNVECFMILEIHNSYRVQVSFEWYVINKI